MSFAGALCWRTAGFVLSFNAKIRETFRWFSQKPVRLTSPACGRGSRQSRQRGEVLKSPHRCFAPPLPQAGAVKSVEIANRFRIHRSVLTSHPASPNHPPASARNGRSVYVSRELALTLFSGRFCQRPIGFRGGRVSHALRMVCEAENL
jgi:hypothetical protein